MKSEYVAFLDDDVWKATNLEKQVHVLESASVEVGLVYCWMDHYDGDEVVERRHPQRRGDIFREMLDSNAITNASTLLVRTAVICDIGRFDSDLSRGIDSDLIRRVAREYKVDYVPEVLVEYNLGREYDRVTSTDDSSLRSAIESTKVKFEKFPDAFDRYPEMYASNLA